MKQRVAALFRFLPTQLLLLHFRKYQLILVFWLIVFAVVLNRFAVNFGAVSLFLAPEYLGKISVVSYFILGGTTAIFAMSWHITTFIIHSKRVPFLGATRHSFLVYCINNSIIPLSFLVTYGIVTARYLHHFETQSASDIARYLLSFYGGYIALLMLSFLYFFRANRNILKAILATIANPSLIKNFIPYDSIDKEYELVDASSYLGGNLKISAIKTPYEYNTRFLNAVLRRHHRNAIFAISFAVVVLLILGIFMDKPIMRIPAGAGFLLLFSIVLCAVGAFKYFLKSWEILGWLIVMGLVGLLAKNNIIDIRSYAYGMEYTSKNNPPFSYEVLKQTFTDSLYLNDKNQEEQRLQTWLEKQKNNRSDKPPLVVVMVSGGGSRAAYWTFRCLQYTDSITNGALFKNSILITGASGGMIGAAYWRSIHTQHALGKIAQPYQPEYQEMVGKDLLNAIVFSLVSVDLISPFNKITFAGKQYNKNRGYAFDNELVRNSNNLLNYNLGDYAGLEKDGISPLLLINGTVINDGRRIIFSPQPVSYLTRSRSSLAQHNPIIDGVDYLRFFKNQKPDHLHITAALRMSATFPLVLPVTQLPSTPSMEIMDAGLRDNFGTEVGMRYISTFDEWLLKNVGNVILLQIRDTRAYTPSAIVQSNNISNMLLNPIFAIQKKWSSFQTFNQTYLQDMANHSLLKDKIKTVTLQYYPENEERTAALNFHLNAREKQDLLHSIFNPNNQVQFEYLKQLLD